MTRSEAETILRQFICVEPIDQPLDHAAIREAVLTVAKLSDYQILGICAETAEEGLRSLSQYLDALGYKMPELQTIPGVIYLKFNPRTGRSHIEPYVGKHRGVLVSCQAAYDDEVNETFGHLPLDLFEQK
ncbi:MAG TPA: DUF1824 family protein [Leptolyngbya sp.]|jgi:hypothetical protein|nr:DUF1824 family protein [Leptolyngbya sp.]